MRYVKRQIRQNEGFASLDQSHDPKAIEADRQRRLRALGPNPKPLDVEKIFVLLYGSTPCSECGGHGSHGVELEVRDTNGDPIVLCGDCIDAAHDLFYDPEVAE